MAVDATKLAAYVGASEGEQSLLMADCLAEAEALVLRYNVKRNPLHDTDSTAPEFVLSDAPVEIVNRAQLEVAADLFHRRNAPNGVMNAQFENFGGDQGQAVRIARDPMQAAYKILGRWVAPW